MSWTCNFCQAPNKYENVNCVLCLQTPAEVARIPVHVSTVHVSPVHVSPVQSPANVTVQELWICTFCKSRNDDQFNNCQLCEVSRQPKMQTCPTCATQRNTWDLHCATCSINERRRIAAIKASGRWICKLCPGEVINAAHAEYCSNCNYRKV